MKRVLLAFAFAFGFCSFATAQTSAKPATRKPSSIVSKSSTVKKNKTTVLKQEDSANAKSDSVFKLSLPVQKIEPDTTAVPVVKKEQGF